MAPWNPAPLPATTCCRHFTRSRLEADCTHPSAWTSDLGRNPGERLWSEAGRVCVECVVLVPQVSVWCVCRCVLPLGFGFLMSPCQTSPGREPGPQAKGLQAALPLNIAPSEGAPHLCLRLDQVAFPTYLTILTLLGCTKVWGLAVHMQCPPSMLWLACFMFCLGLCFLSPNPGRTATVVSVVHPFSTDLSHEEHRLPQVGSAGWSAEDKMQ